MTIDYSSWEPLDDADRAIIECLREDGRIPSSTIAARIGLSEKTVRKRIVQLREERGLRIMPVAEEVHFGSARSVCMALAVEAARMDDVVELLQGIPEVRYVAFTTGAWDLLAEARIDESDESAAKLEAVISALPGIRRFDGCTVIRVAKFTRIGADATGSATQASDGRSAGADTDSTDAHGGDSVVE